MNKVLTQKTITLCIALALGAMTSACGGGGDSRDPILGADVSQPVVVTPAPPVTPPPVVAPPPAPPVVVTPPVVVPPVVVVPPPGAIPPGTVCPTTGPTVTMTDPSNGNLAASTSTTGVANSGKRVTATFSGTLDPSAISASSFKLAPTGGMSLSPASVGYDSNSNVATLTTSSALQPDTNYTAVIEAQLVNGTPSGLACNYAWTFKTAAAPVVAPSPVNFGAAQSFAIAATAGVSNTALSLINGDAVLNPTDTCNAIPVGNSGTFGICGGAAPGINGQVVTPTYPNTTLAQQVTDALRAAYLSITPPSGPPAAGSLAGGMVLATTSIGSPTGSPAVAGLNYFAPGVYKSASAITIADDITLDAKGDANAVFVFQAGSSITATAGAPSPGSRTRVLLVNGAKASNVFWQAGASATLGTYAEWNGSILAGASVTMQTGANSCGRLFAGAFTAGALVMDRNIISIPGNIQAPVGCL